MTTRPISQRTPNLDLRRARQSMGLSQEEFADAVQAAGNAMGEPNRCTKRLVQKWETGEHQTCKPRYLRVLQTLTGRSTRDLGFHRPPEEPGEPATASDGETPGTPDHSPSVRIPAGGRAALPVSGPGAYSTEVVEGSMDRLRHAIEHPSTAGTRDAEVVETSTARLFDLEHHSPARLLTPVVDRHSAMVTGLLTAARHEKVRRSLMISAGRTAMLAGWLAHDRRDPHSATNMWGIAMDTAQATHDTALLAATLTCQSYAAARREDSATAWQLAHTAAAYTPDDPRATVWANARVALYAAQLGEHDEAATALNQSMIMGDDLPDPRPGDGTLPWLRFFDRARHMSATAHTAALLKIPYAFEHAELAVATLSPAKTKSRAVVLAEAALTAAIVGEYQSCLDWGSVASLLARDMNVSTATDLLNEIVPILLPYSDTRAVRELLPFITRLTPAVIPTSPADPADAEDVG